MKATTPQRKARRLLERLFEFRDLGVRFSIVSPGVVGISLQIGGLEAGVGSLEGERLASALALLVRASGDMRPPARACPRCWAPWDAASGTCSDVDCDGEGE